MLSFPHISQCLHLAETLPSTDYGFIVDQQPLGAKLFRQFCVHHRKDYYHYNGFLDAVESYELELEDTRYMYSAVSCSYRYSDANRSEM